MGGLSTGAATRGSMSPGSSGCAGRVKLIHTTANTAAHPAIAALPLDHGTYPNCRTDASPSGGLVGRSVGVGRRIGDQLAKEFAQAPVALHERLSQAVQQ